MTRLQELQSTFEHEDENWRESLMDFSAQERADWARLYSTPLSARFYGMRAARMAEAGRRFLLTGDPFAPHEAFVEMQRESIDADARPS